MTEITSRLANILENNGNFGIPYTLIMNFIGMSLGIAFVGIINLYFMAKKTLVNLAIYSSTNALHNEQEEKEGQNNNEMAQETMGKPQSNRHERSRSDGS